MGRLSGFTHAAAARKLRKLGFAFARQAKGSHEIWRRPADGRMTTLPNHPGTIPEGALRAILREAGVTPNEFLEA